MRPRGAAPSLRFEPRPSPKAGAPSLLELASELPDPVSLAPGSWLEVSRGTSQARGWLRVKRSSGSGVDLALRCSALLLRGYIEICAEDDVAWGRVPNRAPLTEC